MHDIHWTTVTAIALALVMPISMPANAGETAGKQVQLAALPTLPSPSPDAQIRVIPVQAQTCGCTPPPNPKQKIMTTINGNRSCTVTTIACYAP